VGEIGTGYGVGTAWMAHGLAPSTRLVTVELEVQAAQAAASLFDGQDNVEVIAGDWRELLSHGPFNMLFIDAGEAKANDPEPVLDALAPGGMAILDDFTPLDQWPEEWRGRPDPVRNFWLHNPRLASTEILVRPDSAVILAVRTGLEKDSEDVPEQGSTSGLS
jgi:predicted O-methyltransferase YrrM